MIQTSFNFFSRAELTKTVYFKNENLANSGGN